MSNGREWFEHRVRPAPAVYVPFEGQGGVPNRIKAWRLAQAAKLNPGLLLSVIPPDDVRSNIAVITEPINLRDPADRDVDAFERAVLDRRMQHNGNPLLRWQAGNVIVETDAAGNRKPSKAKSLDRIDGIVTAIFACGLAERDEGPQSYRGTGLSWL